MESFLSRYKNSLVLIVIVLAQAIALAVQVQRPKDAAGSLGPDGKHTTVLRYWAVSAMMPFEKVIHWSSFDVRHVWSGYVGLRHTHQENQQLQLELARMRLEQAAFAEDAAQGRRLQALLAFKQQYISATVAAQVIGTSGSDSSRILYLDKGSADGLKPEQAVITPNGVVGKLRDVFPHTAQLLLLNDATSGAGVILMSTRIRGIVRGTASGSVQINNLTADSRIKPGEKVITSGGDMVFPRGLPVGVIESIKPDPQHQPYMAITIKPDANLSQLEEVLVITGTQAEMPAAAQQDAATADATAALQDAQRAADVVAERLPGADAATGSTGSTGSTGGEPAIPKSPGVLHPDRYSPGAPPPAEQMTPGVASPQ